MATAPVPALLTAEEFGRRPDPGYPEELVRGRIVRMPLTKPRHGQICAKAVRILGNYADEHDLGHVLSNDSGVITERGPDTVRGADVAFYSFARVPKGPLPTEYLDVAPELVFEVRSPSDRWAAVLAKVVEYLNAGVAVVCVLDPEPETALLFFADRPARVLAADEEWAVPELLGDFRVPVRRFFE
jgi:Uma2 family endonuclease